jgi:nitrogen regulatory protein PII
VQLHPVKLIKIIVEKPVVSMIINLLKELGLFGYTMYDVKGVGAKGLRLGKTTDKSNVAIEVITSELNAEALLERIHDDHLQHHIIIVYLADIKVIRKEKFI